PGRRAMKSSRPRWPSSWPLFAVKTTSQPGGAAISARSDSSQQTSPPPRSAVDCHHELRGVITTTGGEPEREPAIATTTLRAAAGVYRLSATIRAGAARAAPASTVSLASLDTWIVGAP